MSEFTPLPGRLMWVPDGLSVQNASLCQEYHKVHPLDLCRHAGGKSGTYSVEHYGKEALGFAFGPLGLDRLMHFCRGLDALLQHWPLALVTPKRDRGYRLNALVLLGGYLIMKHAWTTKKLAAAVHEDAEAKFACSWSRTRTSEDDRVLTVKDCWAGIEMAVKKKWLDVACVKDDQKLQAFVEMYRHTTHFFDATWIIPGLVMVAADPISVVTDDNRSTCKKMFPHPKYIPSEGTDVTGSTMTPKSRTLEFDDVEQGQAFGSMPPGQVDGEAFALGAPARRETAASLTSLETVCKDNQAETYEQDSEEMDKSLFVANDFANFFMQNNIGMIVRANWDIDEGLPTKSYGDKAFRAFGIDQVNIRIVDKHGALPTPQDVFRMLRVCEDFLDPTSSGQPAVLVHCKGGFGRSMVLACCLAIYRFNLSGAAMLGWVRVARPGAITCRQQELFLKSLKGKADVAKFARLPVDGGCHASCGVGCTLQ